MRQPSIALVKETRLSSVGGRGATAQWAAGRQTRFTYCVDFVTDGAHQPLEMTSQDRQTARVKHQSSSAATGMTARARSSGAGVTDPSSPTTASGRCRATVMRRGMGRCGRGERDFLMPPQELDLGSGEPQLGVRDRSGEGGRH